MSERSGMADTLGLTVERTVVDPLLVPGLVGPGHRGPYPRRRRADSANFYKELLLARFRFHVFTDRAAKRLAGIGPDELVRRLRARTTTTNHPPAPVMAMLGEIVVHGEDIRRPLGLEHQSPQPALVAVADSWKNSNLLIGAKRRIAGLRLQATDAEWAHGDGPEVSGPLVSLILAMVGRKQVHPDLAGEGLEVLSNRT